MCLMRRKWRELEARVRALEEKMAVVDNWYSTMELTVAGSKASTSLDLTDGLPVKIGENWFVSGTNGQKNQQVYKLTGMSLIESNSSSALAFWGVHMASSGSAGILHTLDSTNGLYINRVSPDGTITALTQLATASSTNSYVTVAAEGPGDGYLYYAHALSGNSLTFARYDVATWTRDYIGSHLTGATGTRLMGIGVRPADGEVYFAYLASGSYYRKRINISSGSTVEIEDHGATPVMIGYKGMYLENYTTLSLYDDSKAWDLSSTALAGSGIVVVLDDSAYPIKIAVIDQLDDQIQWVELAEGETISIKGSSAFPSGFSTALVRIVGPLRPGGCFSYDSHRWQDEWHAAGEASTAIKDICVVAQGATEVL